MENSDQLLLLDGDSHRQMPNSSEDSYSQTQTYKPYLYRFLITTLYCLVSAVNAVMWICTSPITTNLEDIYGLDIITINLFTSLIWFIVYPPMNFVANYILDEMGLRTGILVGGTLTIIGLWLRTLSTISFYYIFAGQLLGALGQPCLMNAPQKLSAVWYPPHERAISTTIASIANPIGVGAGFVLAQFFVNDDAKGDVGLRQVHDLMFFTALLGTGLIVPSFCLFKKKPPTPPSKAADTEKYSYKESLKHLLRNRNYLIFIISTGLLWGSYNVLATALEPILKPHGFASSDSGNLGAITLVAGLIGSVLWGVYVDRTNKFKFSLVFCAGMSILSLGGIALMTHLHDFIYIACATGVYGFFTTPIFPLSYELSAELSFPVAEAASGGLMVVMTQIVGVMGTLGVDALLKNGSAFHSDICFLVVGSIAVLGFIGYLLSKEDLKRASFEEKITSDISEYEINSVNIREENDFESKDAVRN